MYNQEPNSFLIIFIFIIVLVAIYNFYCVKKNKMEQFTVSFIIHILLFSLLYRPAVGDFWHYLDIYNLGT